LEIKDFTDDNEIMNAKTNLVYAEKNLA